MTHLCTPHDNDPHDHRHDGDNDDDNHDNCDDRDNDDNRPQRVKRYLKLRCAAEHTSHRISQRHLQDASSIL